MILWISCRSQHPFHPSSGLKCNCILYLIAITVAAQEAALLNVTLHCPQSPRKAAVGWRRFGRVTYHYCHCTGNSGALLSRMCRIQYLECVCFGFLWCIHSYVRMNKTYCMADYSIWCLGCYFMLQVILNIVGRGMDVLDAVVSPRIHAQLLPNTVYVEKQRIPSGKVHCNLLVTTQHILYFLFL
jgi:hypothetical protein